MQFSQIVASLRSQVITHSLEKDSHQDREILGVAGLSEAQVQQLSYVENAKYLAPLATTQAGALIIPDNGAMQAAARANGIAWLSTANPRLLFAEAIRLFYQPFRPAPGVHATAVIDPSVKLGQDVSVGPHVVIYPDCKIGDRVCIMANAVIYPRVSLGEDSLLHANCTVHERSQIGAYCVIHSGAVIGAEGFGFVPTAAGWYKIEQSGYVVLEDGVEVGCNSAIDRPTVGVTKIGKNTKLDNLVHIAHNAQVGEACAMAAQVGIAGSVTVGNRVILAGQVGVANQAKIGDGAIASAQTGIHGEVGAGEIVSGSPAVPNKLYLKVSAIYKKLPEIYQAFKKLQKMQSHHPQ